MFGSQKRKRRKADASDIPGFEVDEEVPESEPEDHEDKHDEEVVYKKVELALREWIETKWCRRDVADKYFNNPPNCRCKFYSFISFFFFYTLNYCS